MSMTEEDLRKRLDPQYITKEAINRAKDEFLDSVLGAGAAYLTGELTTSIAVKYLATPSFDAAFAKIKEPLHRQTDFKFGPSMMDVYDQAPPEYKAKELERLRMHVKMYDALNTDSPLDLVFLSPITRSESATGKEEIVGENLKKIGISDKSIEHDINESKRIKDGLENLNKKLLEVFKNQNSAQLKEKKQQEWAIVYQGASGLTEFAKSINSKELQVVAGVIQASIMVKQTVDAVNGLSNALTLIGPTAVLGPIGIAAGAIASLINLLASPGPNPQKIILDQIQAISKQLTTLQQTMIEGFSEIHKIQMRTLDTIIKGFDDLQKTFEEQISGLTIEFKIAFERISKSLEYTC